MYSEIQALRVDLLLLKIKNDTDIVLPSILSENFDMVWQNRKIAPVWSIVVKIKFYARVLTPTAHFGEYCCYFIVLKCV